jgi:hypothetical protein
MTGGGIPSWAVRGAKVVCIDADSPASNGYSAPWRAGERIENGHTYTLVHCWVSDWGVPVCDLAEVKRSTEAQRENGGKAAYRLYRFRPLVTKTQEQDVGLFRHLLDDKRVDA